MATISTMFKGLGGFGETLSRVTCWTPTLAQLRYRSRPSLKEPTKFFKKLRFQAACKPIYPERLQICEKELLPDVKQERTIKDNKYALFLARTMREDFYKHPMTAIFHANSVSGNEHLHALGLMYDNNFQMKLEFHRTSRPVAVEALTGTKFEPVLQLIVSRTSLGFCSQADIPKLLHCLKKMPQYLLIGLVYENHLLHRADIETLAKLDLPTMRAQLCHTLQQSSTQLSQILMSNQSTLSHSLSSLASQQPVTGQTESPSDPSS